jgi:uncharacterized peroxidase-related enzyme
MSAPTDNKISRLRVPSDDELTPTGRALAENTRKREGYVPNWLSAFALGGAHTDRLNAYLFPLLDGAGSKSSLTLREREILATIVSVDNGCSYCHALHVDALGKVLDGHWLAHRVALDYREVTELTERERALSALALTLTRTPGEVTDSDIERLRDLGLTDVDIFEAVQIISIINATNRITIALAVVPDRELFERSDV